MASYILTNKAVDDLTNIWNYTYEVWSEAQADRYYSMLLDTCEALADQRLFGKVYSEVGDDILGFRIGRHIIFHRKTRSQELEIVRILHSSMDLKDRIQE